MTVAPRYIPVADHGLLVEFGIEISDAANDAVVALDRALALRRVVGVVEVVPAFVNLLIDFDPTVTDHVEVEAATRDLLEHPVGAPTEPERHVVPVCYDDTFGPDLERVAAATDLSVDGVIAAHLDGDYRVVMYGFAPGCAYMVGVEDRIQVPRQPTPVRGVAADSVIIAGPQCLITTIEMPTGWSIIGRSAVSVLQSDTDRPFLFGLGDHVSFERVDLATFERLRQER